VQASWGKLKNPIRVAFRTLVTESPDRVVCRQEITRFRAAA
jgi:hypothetical protein